MKNQGLKGKVIQILRRNVENPHLSSRSFRQAWKGFYEDSWSIRRSFF